jgi:tRNA dimethylallyltransferase
MNSKALVIVGPTATGKTDVAIYLAKKLNGELIACDSRQVYKGLDIGSGKLPGKKVSFKKYDLKWEVDGVPIWMYDTCDPKITYTAFDYASKAKIILEDVLSRDKLPIIVGGTGLYLKALLYGFDSFGIHSNPELRNELGNLSLEDLQKRLESVNFKAWQTMNDSDKQNSRRLIRAIEVSMNPNTRTDIGEDAGYEILKIGLMTERSVLNNRIDQRLDSRINDGLVEEGHQLYQSGLSLDRMRHLGLEYRYLADLIDKKIDLEQFKEILKNKIHQYAKRQMVWFKKDSEIRWYDTQEPNFLINLETTVQSWYDSATNI